MDKIVVKVLYMVKMY